MLPEVNNVASLVILGLVYHWSIIRLFFWGLQGLRLIHHPSFIELPSTPTLIGYGKLIYAKLFVIESHQTVIVAPTIRHIAVNLAALP